MKSKKVNFLNEKDGQIRFFEDLRITTDVSLTNNTDGVYKGTLFEFKLSISNINKVLFQSIKYLSHMRIKGESIPKTILLIGLNQEIVYKFESKDFLKEIEKEGDMVKTTKKKSVTKKRKSKPKIKISGSYKRRRK